MSRCTHKWEHQLNKDNQHRLIMIYWCTICGAFKRINHYPANTEDEVEIKLPINTIKEEIAKCEVRCANCHKKRHYKIRQNTGDVV